MSLVILVNLQRRLRLLNSYGTPLALSVGVLLESNLTTFTGIISEFLLHRIRVFRLSGKMVP